MRSTLFVNGRFLTHPISGVERYAHELMRYFDQFLADGRWSSDSEIVCLVPSRKIHHPGWKNIKLVTVGKTSGNLWEQTELPLFLQGRPLFSPANSGPWMHRNQAVTMHDANIYAVPHAYTWAFRVKYQFLFRQFARRARLILTDSKFSQNELAKYLKVLPQTFKVVHLGGNHLLHLNADDEILTRNALTYGSYILAVASQSPHKNFLRLIEAIKLVKTGIKFILTGGQSAHVFQQAGLVELPSNVKHLGYVSDRELKSLYNNALGFIFPSLYEGFGLPVLEAMSCGCPVLCSRAASLPEVGGEAVLYFNPMQVDDLAAKLQQFITDVDQQTELRRRGMIQAARFDWEKTANETMLLLQTIL